MNEKVTEDDTIVSHNVIGSGKQYVHQDTQNTKENDIQNTNDDNNNTYIGTQELSNDEESSQSSNNIFNLNFGKIYNEDNKKGDNNSIYSYDKDDLLYSYRNELFDGIK